MAARVAEELGPIDVLVNNAVIFNKKGVLDMPLAEWSQQLAVILDGAFLCTQAIARADGRARARRRDHQRDLHGRSPGPAAQRRLLHREGGAAQLHALGRDGARAARDSREQLDAHGDRSARGHGPGGALGPAASVGAPGRSLRAVPPRRADAAPAVAQRLRARRRLPGLGRRAQRHRHRPARRFRGGRRYWAWDPASGA